MGLRNKLRGLKQFLKDPAAWTDAQSGQMNGVYAQYSKDSVAAESTTKSDARSDARSDAKSEKTDASGSDK